MVRTKLAAAILGAGLLLPGLASALGVGDYTLKSYLNQPLELEIELIQTQDLTPDEVLAALASQDEFNRAGVDRTFFLTDIRFEVIPRGEGRMTVVARSRKPVNEPFLNFLMEVQWPQGRMLREYTILLDPPVYKAGAMPTATAEPIVVAAEPAPAVVAPAAAQLPAPAPAVVQPRSSLPPPPSGVVARAPAPTRNATAQSVGRDAGAGEYRVQASDTMWNIAARHRAEGATVQQTMIAIQRANPEAFIAGNVNLVRTGQVLRIPNATEVQQLSDSSAGSEISSQNRAWRELLDQRAVATPSGEAMLDSRKAPAVPSAAPKATGTGEVKLVAPSPKAAAGATAAGKDAEALKGKLSAAEEEIAKASRQNKELASRLADVEKQVKSSDKLLAMKTDEIADLQAELDRLRKAKGLPSAAQGVAKVATTEKHVAQKPAEQPAEKRATKPADPADAGKTTAAGAPGPGKDGVAASTPEKSDRAKAPMAKEARKPEAKGSSLLLPVAGIIALLGAGGGAFWYLRKRKQQASVPPAASYEESEHDSQIADDLAQLSDLNLDLDADHFDDDATKVSPVTAGADTESSDPLGEAEMYLAYGRFQQAADILYAPLQRDPTREDIRLKLAEAYIGMGDEAAAAEQLTALSSSHSDDIRAQASALLAKIGAVVATAAVGAEEQTPSLDDLALEFAGGERAGKSDGLSFELADESEPMVVAPADDFEFSLDEFKSPDESPAVAEAEFSLDDADMGDFSLQDEAAAAPAATHEFTLDDDFSLGEDITLDDTARQQEAEAGDDHLLAMPDAVEFVEPAASIASDAPTQVMRPVTDADLEAAMATEEVVVDHVDLEEYPAEDLAIEEPGQDEPAQEMSATAETDQEEPVPDDAALDLESELADLEADLSAEGVGADSAGGDDFDFLADSDENATKLDLARAYIEMGDAEGARDILNEVVADGNDVQKTDARKLLSDLG